MKCCVVGGGAAGIISAKHLKDADIDFSLYEKMDDIGGTWIYTEKEKDSLGTPVHTAMYKNLRTNLPKEVMQFNGMDYDINGDKSFIKSQQVYQYLKNFVQKHDLMNNIKLGHLVTKISRENQRWKVTVKNLENNQNITSYYDAVMVCNGHYFEPRIPDIEGRKDYEGLQIHSKYYRVPQIFKDKTILVIGYGPSGQDITEDASKLAKKVYLSHHAKNFKSDFFRTNVISKPDVRRLNINSVTFVDGSTENIDAILYCTGYYYTFPFLDDTCGILVDDNYVRPLHRQFINIKHPSMAFIGLTVRSFIFPLFEIQVKVFIELLTRRKHLPDEKTMMEELNKFEIYKEENSVPKRKYHQLEDVREYIKQVRQVSDVEDLPQVIYKIYDDNYHKRFNILRDYRNYVYKILDNDNFTVEIGNENKM